MKHKRLAFIYAIATLSLSGINNITIAAEQTAPVPTAVPAPAPAAAEDEDGLKMFRFMMRMDKIDFVKKAMALNAEQEKKFMEQYYRYDTELNKLNDERLAIIKDYAAKFDTITDKDADKLVKRSFNFRKQRSALLEKYYGKVAKATSKVIAARFLQVEAVLQGAGDVQVGSAIPLMPE